MASVKLLVDRDSNKVVYAEVSNEVVDVLLGLMELPVGSLLRVFHKKSVMGELSLGKIYESARSLDTSDYQQRDARFAVINPSFTADPRSHAIVNQPSVLKDLVPRTNNQDHKELAKVKGYVRRGKYILTDDLTIEPLSTISAFNLISTYGITDKRRLGEMKVQVDNTKAVMLMRAAFQSGSVLTDVFLRQGLADLTVG